MNKIQCERCGKEIEEIAGTITCIPPKNTDMKKTITNVCEECKEWFFKWMRDKKNRNK